ncbi:hypothetical protein CLOBOL_01618 [Enterocloster bolteae ATCC BAA-613]|uniref:Uncharacterized protein n=1 Tax=Enterocloster bolteae (strain ATCC BAA-613 / DSM 15670 / CCUG 46953 / JCM 12243 / WAL 16351) TaxID=411902 RepID=A8RLH0_ENTBW|nr:hypothetical protein CLOBOL_01618 [Enterocloster bolteae ATCC BAA-613]
MHDNSLLSVPKWHIFFFISASFPLHLFYYANTIISNAYIKYIHIPFEYTY